MTKTANITALVDGFRTEFSMPFTFIEGTLELHLNGVRLEPHEEFVEILDSGFRMMDAPRLGDKLFVQAEIVGPSDTYVAFPDIVATGIDPRSV